MAERDGDRRDIDKKLLHEFLWKNSTSRGFCRLKQQDIGEKFGLNKFQMSRLMADMERLGYIERVGRGRAGDKMKIIDPEVTKWIT